MPSRGGVDLIARRSESKVLAVARAHDVVDRAQLSEQTGLTPQAVSNVVARLIDRGVMRTDGTRQAGVGKPAILYRLAPGSRQAVGVHVTRRGLLLARTDLAGRVRDSRRLALPTDFTPEQFLDATRDEVGSMAAEVQADGGSLVGVGIGMIGPLDERAGIVRGAHGMTHWRHVELQRIAHDALDLPVTLVKDVTAAVVGEGWTHGADCPDTALLLLEAGVGAGFWLAGDVHHGAYTNAGEFGHAVIALDGPACVCGRAGCLEAVHLAALAADDLPEAARVIGTAAVNLVQTLDVARVVLAGTDLLAHRDTYLTGVRDEIRRQLPPDDWREVSVEVSSLGPHAVSAGAAMQVLHASFAADA